MLSGVRTLSAGGQNAFYPQVAVDVAGDAVFTWYRFDGTHARVQARSVSAAGVLSGVRTLSAAGQSAQFPEIGVDAAGNALVTWHRSDGVNLRVQSRTVSTAEVLGPLLTLSAAGQSALFPQLAVTPGGDAVLTWYRSDGANNRVEARTHSAAGVLGRPRRSRPPASPRSPRRSGSTQTAPRSSPGSAPTAPTAGSSSRRARDRAPVCRLQGR